MLIGGFQIGQAAPYVEALVVAKTVAGPIYKIIERVSTIDSSSNAGKMLLKLLFHIF